MPRRRRRAGPRPTSATCARTAPPTAPPRPNRICGDVYIDEVMYGGVVVRDQKVLDRLLDLAASRASFKVTNDLMGGHDPWPRTTRTFTAVSAFGGKAVPVHQQVVKFE